MKARRILAAAAATLLTTTLFAQLDLKPNAVKYRDSQPNAKGRAGSAAIEARALLNRNGSTDIDVTTSDFDSISAPGSVEKVQLAFAGANRRNFNGLQNSGTFTTNVQGLMRGDSVSIQANVRGIDGNRTGVVETTASVRLRPDLAVSSVNAGSPVRGMTANVRATIQELNGDSGARANCRLLIDGIQVDRAEGIWVDASGTVQCAFVATFATAGTSSVTVIADGMNPGDWDEANNSRTIDVTVRSPENFYWWSVRGDQSQFDRHQWSKRSWEERTTHNSGIEQNFFLETTLREPLPTDTLTFNMAGNTDGVPMFDYTIDNFGPPRRQGPEERCRTAWGNGAPEVNICHNIENNLTSVEVWFSAADAVYRSWGWATRRHPWAPEEPRFEWNEVRVVTGAVPLGTRFDMDVSLAIGERLVVAHPYIAKFREETRVDNRAPMCAPEDFGSGTVCFSWQTWTRSLDGNQFGF